MRDSLLDSLSVYLDHQSRACAARLSDPTRALNGLAGARSPSAKGNNKVRARSMEAQVNTASHQAEKWSPSADASDNVLRFAPAFKNSITAVIARCDYIELLAKDVAASSSVKEASLLTKEIVKAAQANVEGDDSSGTGSKGSVPADYGVAQLRDQVQAMIGRENPPYRKAMGRGTIRRMGEGKCATAEVSSFPSTTDLRSAVPLPVPGRN